MSKKKPGMPKNLRLTANFLVLQTVLFSSLLLFSPSLFSQNGTAEKKTAGNPIFPGWYADPEARTFRKQYWIYPTYSTKYEEQVFLDAFSSPDLVNWTKHNHILDTANVKWAKKAVWAPSIVQKGERYYLFFGANDIQNDQQLGGIGVAVADRPEGPFKDYLGKPLVDKFHNGAQPIDQFVFQDKDGQYYLLYGGWRHCNIARLNKDFTGFVPFEDGTTFKEITPKGYVEGSFCSARTTSIISCGRKADGPDPITRWLMPLPTHHLDRLSASEKSCSRIPQWQRVPGIIPSFMFPKATSGTSFIIAAPWAKKTAITG